MKKKLMGFFNNQTKEIDVKKKLFELAFKKAKKESGQNSKNAFSNYLEKFSETTKTPINSITFSRYYTKYIEGDTKVSNNPKVEVLNVCASYLGYTDFGAFNSKFSPVNTPNKPIDKSKLVLIVALIIVCSILFFKIINENRWMIWNETEYIEVPFNPKKYELGQLKLYNEERIKYFKKIDITSPCTIEYFSKAGKVKCWYGKNSRGKLELFSSTGLHPETGKTLDPISIYMIKKYFCNDY